MLRQHLLHRQQRALHVNMDPADPQSQTQSIFFKGDRMYSHKLVQFNYTTYDVRRAQDVVNPGTSHCNIMLLAGARPRPVALEVAPTPEQPLAQPHPYLYARVLGIYHANMIYTGPGMVGYTPKRMDFLWVRWYEHQEGEHPDRLEQLFFPPISSEGAFGFVDPADVVRGCHIIPRFSKGKRHPGGVGFSKLAQDSSDWLSYNIGR